MLFMLGFIVAADLDEREKMRQLYAEYQKSTAQQQAGQCPYASSRCHRTIARAICRAVQRSRKPASRRLSWDVSGATGWAPVVARLCLEWCTIVLSAAPCSHDQYCSVSRKTTYVSSTQTTLSGWRSCSSPRAVWQPPGRRHRHCARGLLVRRAVQCRFRRRSLRNCALAPPRADLSRAEIVHISRHHEQRPDRGLDGALSLYHRAVEQLHLIGRAVEHCYSPLAAVPGWPRRRRSMPQRTSAFRIRDGEQANAAAIVAIDSP